MYVSYIFHAIVSCYEALLVLLTKNVIIFFYLIELMAGNGIVEC